jgi:serine/threonine protein kinase
MSADLWVGPASAPNTYRLVSLIGSGGEGDVWEAVLPLSTKGRRAVAVKIMQSIGDPDEADRWQRIGHLLRSLRPHPGLVRVTDVFTGPGMHRAESGSDAMDLVAGPSFLYVVMDYIDGISLREWTLEYPDTGVAQRLRMLGMVAAALDEMHSGAETEVAVVHGDVKPSNIVVRADRSVVLVDLGLTHLTDAVGVTGRSAPYAAPELRKPDAQATPESDRYAFAVTIAHVLTGKPPTLDADGWLDPGALRELLSTSPLTARRHALVRHIMNVINAPPEARPRQLRTWLSGAVETLSQVTDDPLSVSGTAQPVGEPGSQAPVGKQPKDLGVPVLVRPARWRLRDTASTLETRTDSASSTHSARPKARRRASTAAVIVILLAIGGFTIVALATSPEPSSSTAGSSPPTVPDGGSSTSPIEPDNKVSVEVHYSRLGCGASYVIRGSLRDSRTTGKTLWIVEELYADLERGDPNALYFAKAAVVLQNGSFSATIKANEEPGVRKARFLIVASPDARANEDLQLSLKSDQAHDNRYPDGRRTRLQLGNEEIASGPDYEQRC